MPPYSATTLVRKSYDYIALLQIERDKNKKYRISSRNKVRNLARPLFEFNEAQNALDIFVTYSRDSLTKKGETDSNGNPVPRPQFKKFWENLTDPNDVNGIQNILNSRRFTPDVKRETIQIILGYLNLGAESVCAIFSAFPENDVDVQKRLEAMITREFTVLGEGSRIPENVDLNGIVDSLMNLKKNADEAFTNPGKNHV